MSMAINKAFARRIIDSTLGIFGFETKRERKKRKAEEKKAKKEEDGRDAGGQNR